ncbi:SLAM family member 9-like isoform X2 [Ahaetulla prasina]|uniref:SLAM family member 9-like isoform X2 n=1 Tax=Ahaetulla prasina TaxID=499056 RepID=UPI0026488955|nr:SLAM family member 9-like isoform X2 [Ahaetulla prasina]
MSHKSIVGLWLSLVLLGAEDVEAKVNGILGESVTFKVKTSTPFVAISWTKVAGSEPEIIALAIFQEPCQLQVPFPAYQKRVNISKDCRELHLSHLKKEDAGVFIAGIISPDAKKVDESFDLQIFRRLLGSQLRVTCTPNAAGNGSWQLNCSKEPWEDGVKFSWRSDVRSNDPTLGSSVINLAHNVTCLAENLISKASRTVSLKEVCAEHTETLLTENRLPLWILLGLSKMGSLLLLGSLGLILRVKSSKDTLLRMLSAGRGRPTDSQRNPPPLDPPDRGVR